MTPVFIDVHGHLAPAGERGGGPPGLHDAAGTIERKRALGVEMTIIGSPVGAGSMLPGTGAKNYEQTAGQVRAHNEALGELVADHPDALRAYAYLDPYGGDAMLAQAVGMLKEWPFVGLIVNTSVSGRFLDEAGDFFAMAAEADVPVLLHPPAEPVGWSSMPHMGMVEHIVRFGDVALGVAAIVCAGWLEKYPELKLIAAAGGAGLAQLPEKLDLAMRRGPSPLERPPSESLRKIYVETSAPSRAQLHANLHVFGADRVLFGTDAPPLLDEAERIAGMVESVVKDAEQLQEVAAANAVRLFGPGLGDRRTDGTRLERA